MKLCLLAKASNISKQVLKNAQSLANALHEIFIWKCILEVPGCWWQGPPLGPFSPAPHVVLPFVTLVPCCVSCVPSHWCPLSPIFNLAELSAPLVIFVFRFGSPLYIGLLSRWSKSFWFVSTIISLIVGAGWAWMEDLGSYVFITLLVSLLSLAPDSFGLSSPVSPSLSPVLASSWWPGMEGLPLIGLPPSLSP